MWVHEAAVPPSGGRTTAPAQPDRRSMTLGGTRHDRESDRHTRRSHGQAYLGAERRRATAAPFARPSPPPVVPPPSRCPAGPVPTMSHSKPGSSIRTSSSCSQTPLSLHLQKRRCVFFQPPKSGGRPRHGEPVRRIQRTALTKRLLSSAMPPYYPTLPGRRGSSRAHTRSSRSSRWWSAPVIEAPSRRHA
mgnify:FL=1